MKCPSVLSVLAAAALSAPASCELDYVDPRYPGVAGRVDDFIVAQPAGAEYTLRLTGDHLWCASTGEFLARLPRGEYRVTARFAGQAATTDNLDMKGAALLNFWKGTVRSGEVSFEIGGR